MRSNPARDGASSGTSRQLLTGVMFKLKISFRKAVEKIIGERRGAKEWRAFVREEKNDQILRTSVILLIWFCVLVREGSLRLDSVPSTRGCCGCGRGKERFPSGGESTRARLRISADTVALTGARSCRDSPRISGEIQTDLRLNHWVSHRCPQSSPVENANPTRPT